MKYMRRISLKVFSLLILLTLLVPVIAGLAFTSPVKAEGLQGRMVDGESVLSDSEALTVEAILDQVSEDYGIDVVVVTSEDMDYKTSMDFADDFYDENMYAENGCVLAVSMSRREYWISTRGECIQILTDMGIDFIGSAIKEKLAEGDCAGAFMKFGEMVGSFTEEYRSGNAYDVDNLPDDDDFGFEYDGEYLEDYRLQKAGGFRPFLVVVGLLIGALISFAIMSGYKAQMQTIHSKSGASDYLRRETLDIYDRRDRFLYSQVTRTPKPKPQERSGGHSGGSSIHTSSSGSSHGGGGGSF